MIITAILKTVLRHANQETWVCRFETGRLVIKKWSQVGLEPRKWPTKKKNRLLIGLSYVNLNLRRHDLVGWRIGFKHCHGHPIQPALRVDLKNLSILWVIWPVSGLIRYDAYPGLVRF